MFNLMLIKQLLNKHREEEEEELWSSSDGQTCRRWWRRVRVVRYETVHLSSLHVSWYSTVYELLFNMWKCVISCLSVEKLHIVPPVWTETREKGDVSLLTVMMICCFLLMLNTTQQTKQQTKQQKHRNTETQSSADNNNKLILILNQTWM